MVTKARERNLDKYLRFKLWRKHYISLTKPINIRHKSHIKILTSLAHSFPILHVFLIIKLDKLNSEIE